jgi:preprotein translocase subunit YajC
MIEYAFAQGQAAGGSGTGSSLISFIPIVLMIVIFYFLLIRPQQKKEKDRKNMISALKKGDRVLTAGGIYGVVDSFNEGDIVIVKIANNTKVEMSKNSVQVKVS